MIASRGTLKRRQIFLYARAVRTLPRQQYDHHASGRFRKAAYIFRDRVSLFPCRSRLLSGARGQLPEKISFAAAFLSADRGDLPHGTPFLPRRKAGDLRVPSDH